MPLRLALIHNGPAFKPEVPSYRTYFEKRGVAVEALRRPTADTLAKFDLEWHFTGIDRLPRREGRIKIHEYTSASIPPFAPWKNHLKRRLNVRPDLRIFSSPFIRYTLGFRDAVPSLYRPAPAIASFFRQYSADTGRDFDLVYLGTLHRSRQVVPMLRKVQDRLPGARLLIVHGPHPDLPPSECIQYTGFLPYSEVPRALSHARYGLNLIPDRYPFHRQASLKLVEYAAVGLPIISTDYCWARQFEMERRGRFFFLAPGMRNLSWEALEGYDFRAPGLVGLHWEEVLDRSGIWDWLMERIRSA